MQVEFRSGNGTLKLVVAKFMEVDISIADAGIATMAARTAVIGAGLKVKSFARMLDNREEAEKYIAEAESLMKRAETSEQEILAVVSSKL